MQTEKKYANKLKELKDFRDKLRKEIKWINDDFWLEPKEEEKAVIHLVELIREIEDLN